MRRERRPPAPAPGEEIDDFEIVRMLGRGAFGHVYLARQLSLDREVALKVSANRGSEGRTMARLEHAHIVQVYSEKVDEATDQRLLCMQLVPGIGLEKIIGSIGMQMSVLQSLETSLAGETSSPPSWRGSDVLAIIDTNATMPTALDPARSAIARRWARWTPSRPPPGSAPGWAKRSTSLTSVASCTATSSRPTSW